MSAAPAPSTRAVVEEHGGDRKLYVKGTLIGRLAAVAWRWRDAPAQAVRAWRARRGEDPDTTAPPPRERRSAVFVIMAGQGEGAGLEDVLQSIVRWEGTDAAVVVLDDATTDCRTARIRAIVPDAVVLHHRWPCARPPYQYPSIARLLREAWRRFEADVVIKVDTDALLTGPGLAAAAARVFAEQPQIGLLGTVQQPIYDRWVLARERRTGRAVRRLHDAALRHGYDGRKAHGGVYVLSRAALERMAAAGWLDWRPPVWTLLNEDACVGLGVWACGLSIGWPGGDDAAPIRSVSHEMPMMMQDVRPAGVLAVHSVRRGLAGENEAEVRHYFGAERRASSDAGP